MRPAREVAWYAVAIRVRLVIVGPCEARVALVAYGLDHVPVPVEPLGICGRELTILVSGSPVGNDEAQRTDRAGRMTVSA